jgi:hypothetical protein
MSDTVVTPPVPVVVTWKGDDGLVSRKTEIPWDVWITLKWADAF